VGTQAELEYINQRGQGKAAAVHLALRLLQDIETGAVTVTPRPDYLGA
jgi:hypothetical protein